MRGGRRLGPTETRFTNQAPALYRSLRGERADTPAAMARALPLAAPPVPGHVGRTSPRNVVLAPGPAVPAAPRIVRLTATQAGRTAFTATVRMTLFAD
ncbi:hypothetical protein [Streptomyces omiyaensis]|uniref:hypothetical protein n=1 Tax=Streptomyces omiyaensis TaxID=68247 RepID=UPI0036FF78FB